MYNNRKNFFFAIESYNNNNKKNNPKLSCSLSDYPSAKLLLHLTKCAHCSKINISGKK